MGLSGPLIVVVVVLVLVLVAIVQVVDIESPSTPQKCLKTLRF